MRDPKIWSINPVKVLQLEYRHSWTLCVGQSPWFCVVAFNWIIPGVVVFDWVKRLVFQVQGPPEVVPDLGNFSYSPLSYWHLCMHPKQPVAIFWNLCGCGTLKSRGRAS